MYKSDLIKLIVKGIVGFIIGFSLVYIGTPESVEFSFALIMGIFMAGAPYGWQLTGKFIGGLMVIGSPVVMVCAFVLRLLLAVLVGWIAYPIALIYTIIKMIRS